MASAKTTKALGVLSETTKALGVLLKPLNNKMLHTIVNTTTKSASPGDWKKKKTTGKIFPTVGQRVASCCPFGTVKTFSGVHVTVGKNCLSGGFSTWGKHYLLSTVIWVSSSKGDSPDGLGDGFPGGWSTSRQEKSRKKGERTASFPSGFWTNCRYKP